MRKRVVEFDDVINRQRETIYAERDKVLRNEDLTETVRVFVEEEIDAIVDDHLVGRDRRRLGHGGARGRAQGDGPRRPPGTTEDELWELGSARGDPRAPPRDRRRAARGPREGGRRGSTGRPSSGSSSLRTIDSLWVEHLTEIDDMRRGIGLRGYAQQDPLNEFRKEAFRLYEELRGLIRHQVATTIFRVTVTRQPTPAESAGRSRRLEPARRPSSSGASTCHGDPPGGGPATRLGSAAGVRWLVRPRRSPGGSRRTRWPARCVRRAAAPRPRARPSPGSPRPGQRIGRNDACWCGSGPEVQEVPRPLSRGHRAGADSDADADRCCRQPRPGSRWPRSVGLGLVRRLHDLPDLGRGQPRRGPPRRRDRRPGRRPVQRRAVAALPRHGSTTRSSCTTAGSPRTSSSPAASCPGDRTTEAEAARAYARSPTASRPSAILVEDQGQDTLESAAHRRPDAQRPWPAAPPSSSPTGRTCCGASASPATRGSRPTVRRRRDQPGRVEHRGAGQGHDPRDRRPRPLLPDRRAVSETGARIGLFQPPFLPLGSGGFPTYTAQNSPAAGRSGSRQMTQCSPMPMPDLAPNGERET